ncbi:RrF2 family transcriptional regulator [Ruixingdingia sedimenti]|uniref:Rrf2 family transcriptional regulator n=1 Tax=Ruixingdingia sedimenti TaxID=3073604 RepID=A0ABU1FBM6_9RHOB|nr:Rrf2 family transcriptional regulator [Xinfangfangia sp. LG-4]MDR5653792.1 Rrf2 family transcriptional regulator [Xinfangfangia sp. LG-4]
MRLTIRTNLAMRVLMYCAVNPGQTVRKQDIAARCNASENHLAQVIHSLGLLGFIKTHRGRGGGMQLARDAAEISVGSVMRAMEGDLPFTECFAGGGNTCPLSGSCRLSCVLADAVEAFYAQLDRQTVADLVKDNKGLEAVLAA